MPEWTLIVATGPSFSRADSDLFRGRCKVVAVNCAVFYVPWADYVFAGDNVWWRYYGPKINWFKGERYSKTYRANGVKHWSGKGWPRTGGNSGHMAIQNEVDMGTTHIALLGFDHQRTEGKAHCHADHPRQRPDGTRTNLANSNGVGAWPRLMNRTAVDLKERGITVVNLTRQTALNCFPRMTPEQYLESELCL